MRMSSLHARPQPNRFKTSISRLFPRIITGVALLVGMGKEGHAQPITLKDAVNTALINYGIIKAKANYVNASKASAKAAAVDFLPNLNLGFEQSYGTINGQFGPQFALGGVNAVSAGPPFPTQNWHAAFGGLYVTNVNWDFFTFGRVREKVRTAEAQVARDAADLEQERFQHQVRVASAYLNLLAANRLKIAQQKNVDRANALRTVVIARTANGLNAGVDSSLANAEVSSARIALTNARNYELEQGAQLAQLMGVAFQEFIPDTVFINKIPQSVLNEHDSNAAAHPLLEYYRSRIELGAQQAKYTDRLKYPVFSLIGVLQSRGSGFENSYNELHPDAFSGKYWTGIKPTRTNYLVGLGVSWNITNIRRINKQAESQEFVAKGLQDEYDQVSQQLRVQVSLAEEKMKNALANFKEAPIQLKAASDAYLQKTVLYRNGLATIVDVTQALYALNRAETDRDIANNNVWQALLLKAAASGDFALFLNEF